MVIKLLHVFSTPNDVIEFVRNVIINDLRCIRNPTNRDINNTIVNSMYNIEYYTCAEE